MSHPLDDYVSEAEEARNLRERRRERVIERLKDVTLGAIPVSRLADLVAVMSGHDYQHGALARIEQMVCDMFTFRRGTKVRLIRPKKGQTRTVGTVRRKPRPNAKRVYVVWKRAFSGSIPVEELEIVPP